jgi:hypothetical protein
VYLLVIAIEIDLVKPSIDPQIGVLARTFFSLTPLSSSGYVVRAIMVNLQMHLYTNTSWR